MTTKNKEFLIIGLGNPGDEYDLTRHNAGYLVLDKLAEKWNCSAFHHKWDADVTSTRLDGYRVNLIKPLTYMNRSGSPVARFCQFYKMSPDQLLVIHDDLDMHPGRIKLVKGGGAGGHKGIKSIVEHLGTKDFIRLKIGIGRPGQGDVHKEFPVEKYVLSNFSSNELEVLDSRFQSIEIGLRNIFDNDLAKAMNLLNGLK